jgi:hypothetical protein
MTHVYIHLTLLLFSLTVLTILAPTLAHSSNESSYKLGYKVATDNLTGLITVPSYWNKSTSLPDICDSGEGCPSVYDAENYYCLTGQNSQVTNSTACLNGYVQSWKDWCIGDNYKNARYCTLQTVNGAFPGSFDNEDKEMLATMPLKSMLLGSTWNFVNESNGFKAQGPDIIPSSQLGKYTSKIISQNEKIFGPTSDTYQSPMFFMNNVTNFSGKIKFYENMIQINASNGLNPTYTSNPLGDIEGNHTLVLYGTTPVVPEKDGGGYFPFQPLTFLKISTYLIELKDKHGDIILLTRNHTTWREDNQFLANSVWTGGPGKISFGDNTFTSTIPGIELGGSFSFKEPSGYPLPLPQLELCNSNSCVRGTLVTTSDSHHIQFNINGKIIDLEKTKWLGLVGDVR